MDRIHRLGDDLVNFYLVEDDTGLTLVDAGLPSHHAATMRVIAALAKPLRAILLTHAHLAYHFPSHGALFTGDALVTYDSIVGRTGPCTACRAFTVDSAQALHSLEALTALEADLVLPGHGAPFHGTPKSAVTQAQRAGTR